MLCTLEQEPTPEPAPNLQNHLSVISDLQNNLETPHNLHRITHENLRSQNLWEATPELSGKPWNPQNLHNHMQLVTTS